MAGKFKLENRFAPRRTRKAIGDFSTEREKIGEILAAFSRFSRDRNKLSRPLMGNSEKKINWLFKFFHKKRTIH